ncbi:MAG: hypothetical protein AAGE18_10180 [Pseudomonadota bacterium]
MTEMSPILSHDRPRRAEPPLALTAEIGLARGRVHELCGIARTTLALMLAGQCDGPILWIRPEWESGRPNPDGIWRFLMPGRLTFAEVKRRPDLLWSTEEALRSGAAPVVVVELEEPPRLTPVRRLHLAAEAGQATTGRGPVGLLLTPGNGGAQGVETRWALRPQPEGCWRLDRLRARMAPPAAWQVERTKPGAAPRCTKLPAVHS